MEPFWKRLWPTFSDPIPEPAKSAPVPTPPPPPVAPRREWYPNTYLIHEPDERVEWPELFDPALQHFPRAFRIGEPQFRDPELGQQWYAARRQIMDHLLQTVEESRWRDHLILRGSMLLHAWFGEAAREPGDIDWIVSPAHLTPSSAWAKDVVSTLTHAVKRQPLIDGIQMPFGQITTDQIWAYDRAPGLRVVFPWRKEGLPDGSVQMDIVFGEELWRAPVETSIPRFARGSSRLWTATKELSLAWKLMWLESDVHPQGKDLYDATLLAESCEIPPELLRQMLVSAQLARGHNNPMSNVLKWDVDHVDWDGFVRDHPWVSGTECEWHARLTAALAPVIAQL